MKISPTLRAWLDIGGALPVSNWMKRILLVKRAAGVPFPRNAARHSFCSYHLAQFENAAKTALEAGHSEAMLFAHYREVVTPENAAEFWNIRPPQQMLSASYKIPADALPLFTGKRVRIFAHSDAIGFAAAMRWTAQLKTHAGEIDAFSLAGICDATGRAANDLNGFAQCEASPETEKLLSDLLP